MPATAEAAVLEVPVAFLVGAYDLAGLAGSLGVETLRLDRNDEIDRRPDALQRPGRRPARAVCAARACARPGFEHGR